MSTFYKVLWFKSLCLTIGLWLCFNQKLTAQVVINEYCCSNISVFPDESGNYEDWIELYNTSGSAVNLAGYFLSDNPANPAKWTFPAGVTIPANGRLMIMCSNNNAFGGTYYHTNFKLTQTKPESIIFSNPASVVLENIVLNPTQMNHSRGRTTDGAATWSLFTTPTPNAANSGAVQDYTAKPTLSIQAGFYTSSQTVSLSSSTPGATIRYTTNGFEPTATSTLYTAPFNVATTQVIRAKAFSSVPGQPPSFTNSNTYFINSSHTIPVVSVFGDDVMTLLNGGYIDADAGLEFFDKSQTLRAEATGTTNKHGNDSWFYDQRGFDFVTKDQYGSDYALRWKLFTRKNRTEFQRVIIKALANDNYPFESDGAHIRDPYVHTLSQRARLHMDERTYEPCVLYVNGQYWGVYDLREKVDDGDFIDYYHNSSEKNIQMLKTWGGTWSEFGGTQAQTDWNNLSNFILTNNMAIPANYHYVDSLYSVKSLVDYIVLNSYVVCSDWLNWNTEWWRGINPNADKKKWRYCLWDEDATFGHYINYTGVPSTTPDADPCNPENLGDPGGQGHVPILNALMNNPEFYQYYVTRFADLANTSFRCDSMIFLLDSLITQFQPEMAGQIARWGGTMVQWQQNVQALRDFINARCAQLSQGMIDCYNVTGPYNINFNVVPPNSGTIEANSITIPVYPWSGNYYGNIQTLLKAHANPGYMFDYWEVTIDAVTPNINDDTVSATFTAPQNVIAHFKTLEPVLVVTATTYNPLCPGNVQGSIQLAVTGGTSASGLYQYQWSNGSTSQNISNVPAGIYSVTVTDDDTCVAVVYDTIIAPQIITLNTSPDQTICNGESVTLSMSVTGGTLPYHYFWNGGLGNSSQTYNPTTAATYVCHVVDDNGCQGPTDTIHISVSPPVQLSLILSSDNVCPGTEILGYLSVSDGAGSPYTFYTDSESFVPPLIIVPNQTTPVIVHVEDACGSVGTATDTLHVVPLPLIDFTADYNSGCAPVTVCFENLTNPRQPGQTYFWKFIDNTENQISTQISPCHTWNSSGDYSVFLQVTTPEGCKIDTTKTSMITVYSKPEARFDMYPKNASIVNPYIHFDNLSSGSTSWIWNFGDGTGSTSENPMHKYDSIAEFPVTLISISSQGCRDTASWSVNIYNEITFYAPNIITVDNNDDNDIFNVYTNGVLSEGFHLYIYNRWSQVIFETTDIKEGWNGKYKNEIVPFGAYTWIAVYTDITGRQHTASGPVTVIK